ncbi:MAG: hypothetical protein LBU07_05180 [Coriobacteriales bacterium]|jgi:hypothetical protein|nr:hypothetical protein [Coriobacteriales bacterium]
MSQISPGGGARSLALLPSTNIYEGASVRAKDAAQAYAPSGFLLSEIAQIRTQEAPAAWASRTEGTAPGDGLSRTVLA